MATKAEEIREVTVINGTNIDTDLVMAELGLQHAQYKSLAEWHNQATGRNGGVFQRDRYVTPKSMFDQFRTAQDAADTDDVVSGVLEATEALAFTNVSVDVDQPDQENIWNQILDDIDLDSRLREIWRDLFVVSQSYIAVLWGRKDYTVQGKTADGVKRKKKFSKLMVPISISLLDPLKVLPVGNFAFGNERLAYIADKGEAEQFDHVLAGTNTSDLVVQQLIEGEYKPSEDEKKLLKELTGQNRALTKLYLLRKENVFRHTATRPSYDRFAPCRMKSVFELLHLKQQLRHMDRATMIGGANFIVLVKMGDKEARAEQADIEAMTQQMRAGARVPVIVGDYTLEIEIVTPKTDLTLKAERHNAIDLRLTARLYQLSSSGSYSAGYSGDDSIKISRVIAKGLESRRYMIKRAIEREILMRVFEKNAAFTEKPEMVFHPRQISLSFDPHYANLLFDAYEDGALSRETFLAELEFSEAEEAKKKKREEELYGDIFDKEPDPLQVQKREGRRTGGNKNGGGVNKEGFEPSAPRGPADPMNED